MKSGTRLVLAVLLVVAMAATFLYRRVVRERDRLDCEAARAQALALSSGGGAAPTAPAVCPE